MIERGKMYVTLKGVEYSLDELTEEELKFLQHLEHRSMLDGKDYLAYMKGVTVWKHPAYGGRKDAALAECPVYKMAEDMGFRLGMKTGEIAPPSGKKASRAEALAHLRTDELKSKIIPESVKLREKFRRDKS